MRTLLFAIAIVAIGLVTPQASAEQTLLLRADSSNAMGVTGDIKFSRTRVVFASGAVMKIERVARDVYRVISQPDRPLKEGGTVCGRPITYITLHRDPNGLYLLNATWENAQPATPTPDMFMIDTACAVYGYIGQ